MLLSNISKLDKNPDISLRNHIKCYRTQVTFHESIIRQLSYRYGGGKRDEYPL
jgi:hypothetical protein